MRTISRYEASDLPIMAKLQVMVLEDLNGHPDELLGNPTCTTVSIM
jgi:hypothetical protein